MDRGLYTAWLVLRLSLLDEYILILLAISYSQFVRDYFE